MEPCICCQYLLEELKSYFRQANAQEFHKIWRLLTDASDDLAEDQDQYLLVRFKLQVYFAVQSDSMDKLSLFLQQDGSSYSKFPQLAPFFALPYIKDNIEHPLLVDIRKSEWIDSLEQDWIDWLRKRVHYNHTVGADILRRRAQNYIRLKDKYCKLKEDHKMLIDLASQLVTALQDSLRGNTSFAVDTFEYYSQEIKQLSDDGQQNQGGMFRWEANSLKKSSSTTSVDSENLN